MARKFLFEFMYDRKRIEVMTGEHSLDVFYTVNDGRTISAGLRYRPETGMFSSRSGAVLTHDEAEAHVRDLL